MEWDEKARTRLLGLAAWFDALNHQHPGVGHDQNAEAIRLAVERADLLESLSAQKVN